MSIILSPIEASLFDLSHEIGDKFQFDGDLALYDEDFHSQLQGRDIIVEIESYELFKDGHIGFRLKFIKPGYDWKWTVPMTILDEDFIALGKNLRNSRFTILE